MRTFAEKMNRVLGIILVAFLGIVFRIWHLGVIQREERLLEAQKPQQRTHLVRADRGTICDRFQIPLALNRICYNAAVYYGQIAQIPTVSWKSDATGKQIKTYARKEYIRELSKVLAKELDMDPLRIEDLIHSKASLLPHVPFIIKGGITEKEHYRLRMVERDLLGVHAEIASERYYPLGKTACSLLGTMGAISQKEYGAIAQEISELQAAAILYEQGLESGLPRGIHSFEEVYQRLKELKEKAYGVNDLVGKTGLEGRFEESLRGYFGKKIFEVDQKGRFLRELPGGRDAIAGRQLVLTISAELQQFAERLLIQDEKVRDGRSIGLDPVDKVRKVQKQPWIKGGAIVAMDPKTGEILALASAPRFDPNDFIFSANPAAKERKQRRVSEWLESEKYIGAVWDGKENLKRERTFKCVEEEKPLTWELYLDFILPSDGALRAFFSRVDELKTFIQIQEDFETLLYFSKLAPKELIEALGKISIPEAQVVERRLEAQLSSIPSSQDKLFCIDLCRMAVYSPAFTDALIEQVGSIKIGAYRSFCQAFQRLDAEMRKSALLQFRKEEFALWREQHQKEFLEEKRREEKEKKIYPRPYIDYLDQKEKELFAQFWEEKRIPLLLQQIDKTPELSAVCYKLSPELAKEFLCTFRSFEQLDRPLLGKYKRLRSGGMEKNLAMAFYPIGGFALSRSYAFQAASPQGSIFKLVTAYEGLRQGHSLTIFDEPKGGAVAFSASKTPYPRMYKGGRLPRSASTRIGKIDLLGAIEHTSNPYFSILAGDYFADPEDLARAASLFGFGEKSGIDLPCEMKGNIPNDLKTNRTGLYSTAIGQHTLLTTPLQTAGMLAALANGGKLLKPKIIKEEIGLSPNRSLWGGSDYFAKKELDILGIPFSLFTAVQSDPPFPESSEQTTEVKRVLPLSESVRSLLIEAMDRVVWSSKGSARKASIKGLLRNPAWMRDYQALEHQMVGKTGTAEILHNASINPSSLPQMMKYIWFGAICFEDKCYKEPELVVVVFLRYGDVGKEAAPLAAQMIHKWREIKAMSREARKKG